MQVAKLPCYLTMPRFVISVVSFLIFHWLAWWSWAFPAGMSDLQCEPNKNWLCCWVYICCLCHQIGRSNWTILWLLLVYIKFLWANHVKMLYIWSGWVSSGKFTQFITQAWFSCQLWIAYSECQLGIHLIGFVFSWNFIQGQSHQRDMLLNAMVTQLF